MKLRLVVQRLSGYTDSPDQTSCPMETMHPLQPRHTPWLRSPLWDSLWLLSGLWTLTLGVGLQSAARGGYIAITACFWIGHRLSSAYLAYCHIHWQPLLRQRRRQLLIGPALVAGLLAAACFTPSAVIGASLEERVLVIGAIDYLWGVWHFAGQHYGIVAIYRLRAKQRTTAADRADRSFCLLVGGLAIILAEISWGAAWAQKLWMKLDGSDPMLELVFASLRTGALTLIAAWTALIMLRETRRTDRSLPKALYLLSVGAQAAAAFVVEPLTFIMFWTAQHWLVSVGLTTFLIRQANQAPSVKGRWYRLWAWTHRPASNALLTLIVISVLLMPVMEVEATHVGARYTSQLSQALADWLAQDALRPLLTVIGFSSGFMHYLLDRAMFRLRDPAVRQTMASLLDPK